MSEAGGGEMGTDDEDWLRLVGELAREQKQRDEEDVARMADSEEGRRLLAPLDDAARARIGAAAFRDARRPRAKVITLGAFGAGGALAVAAAVALTLGTAGRPLPLPAYEVAVSGPASALRGAPARHDAASIELTAASPFELVFRPSVDVHGAVAAEAFVVEADGAHRWDVPIEVSPVGAVRIAGAAERLFEGRRGDVDLLVVVARPADLPDAAHVGEWVSAEGAGPRVARVHVRIAP